MKALRLPLPLLAVGQLSIFSLTSTSASDTPYPRSQFIATFSIEEERLSIGHGDNWAITWGADDRQYSFFTDGKGFGLHPEDVSMAPVVISGHPPDMVGEDIRSETGTFPYPPGQKSKKVCGILMVEGVLYAWVRNLNLPGTPDGTGCALMFSRDQGKTWEWTDWNWPEIGYPTWMNAGQNYAAAEDGFAYCIAPDGPSAYADYENMVMARVSTASILDGDAYEFYTGTDQNGAPIWGGFAERQAVFTDPKGCFRPDLVYNPGLDRYFLLTCSPFGDWDWWANENPNRVPHLGIFDAPSPWGPWTTVHYVEEWGRPENRFAPHIPPKWISEDGKSFYLLYSCIPTGPYRFNIQRCTLDVGEK